MKEHQQPVQDALSARRHRPRLVSGGDKITDSGGQVICSHLISSSVFLHVCWSGIPVILGKPVVSGALLWKWWPVVILICMC